MYFTCLQALSKGWLNHSDVQLFRPEMQREKKIVTDEIHLQWLQLSAINGIQVHDGFASVGVNKVWLFTTP